LLAAALPPPRLDVDRPRAGEEDARVRRVHREVGDARRLVHEEDAVPALAAVRRPVDAALLLRAVAGAERGHERDVGVPRVDRDARDAARLLEAEVRP